MQIHVQESSENDRDIALKQTLEEVTIKIIVI